MQIGLTLALFMFAVGAIADEHYVYFAGGGKDSVTMNGDTDVLSRVQSKLGKDPGRILVVTRSGKDYAIRDPKLLKPLDEPMARMNELGKKQEILGRHQSALGSKQSELGSKQSELGTRMGAAATARTGASGSRAQKLDEEIETLRNEMQALGAAQATLGDAQATLGREQGRLGQEQGKIARESEVVISRIADQAIGSGGAERL